MLPAAAFVIIVVSYRRGGVGSNLDSAVYEDLRNSALNLTAWFKSNKTTSLWLTGKRLYNAVMTARALTVESIAD